jgi:hypothetical protein
MRYGSVLQRRLVKLESTIKVPTLEDQWTAIQTEALSNLSPEDLRTLREIVVNKPSCRHCRRGHAAESRSSPKVQRDLRRSEKEPFLVDNSEYSFYLKPFQPRGVDAA